MQGSSDVKFIKLHIISNTLQGNFYRFHVIKFQIAYSKRSKNNKITTKPKLKLYILDFIL